MKVYFTLFSTLITFSSAQKEESEYIPAKSEQHVIDTRNDGSSSGCHIWNTPSPLRDDLQRFRQELHKYNKVMKQRTEFAPDVRTYFDVHLDNRDEVCLQYADPPADQDKEVKQSLRGRDLRAATASSIMQDYFNESTELSYLPKYGYMEPLVPPLRHPDMCIPGNPPGFYMATMDFMIEDFGHICRHQLQKNTRNVFLDLGATYNFNSDVIDSNSPAIRAIEKYRRNGIHFDHIYAYEIKKWETEVVYKTIPTHMQGPLHWINTGVTGEKDHKHNPWTMLKENFGPGDFVVVKLDIDTVSVEMPLFEQLLKDPELQELVDVFYFEHHIKMDEMQRFWGPHDSGLTKGSIYQSLHLFGHLRKAGVAAHYWI
mmetsp:Transcript_3245/g.4951  ORF Transcript_3245/g.4951 Transcript_3245/m.4951 type:complete len:371 (-) Transcript_3245:61-1173(-)